MIRKLILGAVTAVAVGFGGPAATAGEPVRGSFGGPVVVPVGPVVGAGYDGFRGPGYYPPRRVDYDYVVFVRRGWSWERYGRYETRREAERVRWFLESRGFRAHIEVVRDRRGW